MNPHRTPRIALLARIAALGTALVTPLLAPRIALAEPCAATPDGSVSETRPAKANGVVDIEVFDGSVKVVGWNRPEVSVRGHLEEGSLDVTTAADRTRIRVVPRNGEPDGELEIRVPQASVLELKSVQADVSVRDVTGALRLSSASGDVTVSGSPSDVNVRTASGDVELDVASASVNARAISGSVHVKRARGRAVLETVSGDCTLEGGDFTEADLRSVSGEVLFVGGIVGQGTFELKSHSGEVTMKVPPSVNADFELRSFSGELQTRLGAPKTVSSALDFRAGSGGAKVRIRTFSGDVLVDTK